MCHHHIGFSVVQQSQYRRYGLHMAKQQSPPRDDGPDPRPRPLDRSSRYVRGNVGKISLHLCNFIITLRLHIDAIRYIPFLRGTYYSTLVYTFNDRDQKIATCRPA